MTLTFYLDLSITFTVPIFYIPLLILLRHSFQENIVSSLRVEKDIASLVISEDDGHPLPGTVELQDLHQKIFLFRLVSELNHHIVLLVSSLVLEATESGEVQKSELIWRCCLLKGE